MEYKYLLPNSGEKTTDCNSLIIIGANGAGKSKLGAWIEKESKDLVHRIGAQRKLNFKENLSLKPYSESEDRVIYGINDKSIIKDNNKIYRWGDPSSYTTKLIDDFDDVLSALLALDNNEKNEFYEACKEADNKGEIHPKTSDTILDKLRKIWDDIFPQRKLLVKDSKFYATFSKDGETETYSANQMSDGERAVLYLVSQVLCLPKHETPEKHNTLIIDEPEVHLHPSIMHKLWLSLEDYREDLLFIYITHDIHFASMHSNSDKIWIKDYDGENWTLNKIESSELPENLLLDILGSSSRKNVLFVEGNKNSYDTQLYSEVYQDYHIVPCGSCTQVIEMTKAFRKNSSLHNCKIYGIIDRDYRSDYEINKYKDDGIFTLNVAEVENLFIVEELVRLMAHLLAEDEDDVFNNVKNYIVDMRFKKQINKQINQSIVSEIKYRLSSIEILKQTEDNITDSIKEVLNSIIDDIPNIIGKRKNCFNDILENKDYAEIIKVFNEKNLSETVGHHFGINNKSYCQKVINFLRKKQYHDKIINAIIKYLPSNDDIPMKKQKEQKE